jgi:hypothetical protein
MLVQNRLIVRAGARLEGSARNLAVGLPAGRIGAKGRLFLGVVVGDVPAVFVDLAAHRDRIRLGVDAGAERVRALWIAPSGPVSRLSSDGAESTSIPVSRTKFDRGQSGF